MASATEIRVTRECVVCGQVFAPGLWRHGKRKPRPSGRVTCSDECADDRRMVVQAGIPLGVKATREQAVILIVDRQGYHREKISVWCRGDWFKYERSVVRDRAYPEFEECLGERWEQQETGGKL